MGERRDKNSGATRERVTERASRFSPTGPDGKPFGFSTLAVHGGEPRPKLGNALATPIVQTATYTFADTQELHDHFQHRIEREEYGRYGNPTQRIAEQKLAALEGAEDCLLFSSGMAGSARRSTRCCLIILTWS
jgi:O-acetylhomoserine/O-acetylserine sulfhydrylase-like pyridoxal-dependent enzyme